MSRMFRPCAGDVAMPSRNTPSNSVGAAPVVPRTESVVTMSAARSAHETL